MERIQDCGDLILWHVSFERVEEFVPRVPKIRMDGEDDTMPRICVGTDIKRCIMAMPDGGFALKGLLSATKTAPYMVPIIHAYVVIVNSDHEGLIGPAELASRYGVLDAEATGEHWLTQPTKFEHRIFQIYDAEFKGATDQHGNQGYLIKNIEYDMIKHEPKNTFEKIWKSRHSLNHIDIRQALKVMSEECAV